MLSKSVRLPASAERKAGAAARRARLPRIRASQDGRGLMGAERRPAARRLRRGVATLRLAGRGGRTAAARHPGRAPGEVNSLRLLGVALLDQDKVPRPSRPSSAPSRGPQYWEARTDLARAYRAGRLQAAKENCSAWWRGARPGRGVARLRRRAGRPREVRRREGGYERARQCDPHARRIEEASAALLAEDRKKARAYFATSSSWTADTSRGVRPAAVALTVSRGEDAVRLLRHASGNRPPAAGLRPVPGHGRSRQSNGAEAAVRRLLKIEPENPKNWCSWAGYARGSCGRRTPSWHRGGARLNPQEVRLRLSIGTCTRRSAGEPTARRLQGLLQLDPSSAKPIGASPT